MIEEVDSHDTKGIGPLDPKEMKRLMRVSLGEEKADPDKAHALLDRAQKRLENADYSVVQTPYGYFLDLTIKAPGHPLARVYKEF